MSAQLKIRYSSPPSKHFSDAGDDQQCLGFCDVPGFEAVDPDLVASRLAAMRNQESGPYCSPGDALSPSRISAAAAALGCPALAQSGGKKCPVDVTCRTKMVDWCYTIADYCNFDRGVVSASFSSLDRYIATPAGSAVLFDRSRYQLASMTALYTAVKMTEPVVMGPDVVAGLSRGIYSEHEVTQMEMDMLVALGWRVNPPTAVAFLRNFMTLLPNDAVDFHIRTRIFELAKYQTELAVGNYELSAGVRPSLVAYAALLNAYAEAVPCDAWLPGFLNIVGVVGGVFDGVVSKAYLDDGRKLLLMTCKGGNEGKVPPSPSSIRGGIEAAEAVSMTPLLQDELMGSRHSSSPRCVSQREV